MSIEYYRGSQYEKTPQGTLGLTILTDAHLVISPRLRDSMTGGPHEAFLLGLDYETGELVIEPCPPTATGTHIARARKYTIHISARNFLNHHGIAFASSARYPAYWDGGRIRAQLGDAFPLPAQQPEPDASPGPIPEPERSVICGRCGNAKSAAEMYNRKTCRECQREYWAEAQRQKMPRRVAWKDHLGQIYYIAEMNKSDPSEGYTVWRRTSRGVDCMASLLEDRTYPTCTAALSALKRYAKTQKRWQLIKLKARDRLAELAGTGAEI